ncbi:serine protease [Actinomadura montaniterrae]|uniref:Serine protease n=1 Tax=Actinomadura montaniterrae TaxID=1803903 RepID=A0A6L3W205_9ACTN|nr:serine protease [Actinomadura montaniterrae]KAB2388208.1 serine protease [Actinomadura montaniterrae]
MAELVERALVRVWRGDEPVGVGFLIDADRLITCAHVAAYALERDRAPLGALIEVDLPLIAEGGRMPATVTFVADDADVAGLRIAADDLPGGAMPLQIVAAEETTGHPVRLYGCPAGRPQGVWAQGLIRGNGAGGRFQIDDDRSTGIAIGRGFSGGPVLDVELGAVVGMLVESESRPERRTGYALSGPALHRAWPGLAEASGPAIPFRGLDPFEENHREQFFGRERLTAQLLDELNRGGLIVVTGPSGCGKSSLVRAGLVPELRAADVAVAKCRLSAGETPWSALAAALCAEPSLKAARAGVAAAWANDPDLLAGRLAERPGDVFGPLAEQGGLRRIVMVVDQVDEALARSERETVALLAVLTELVGPGRSVPFALVVTVGPVSLGTLLEDRRIGQRFGDAAIPIRAPDDTELRALIERPLAPVGMPVYQDGLVDAILADLVGEPNPLPLLEFTLTLLWERRVAGLLRHDVYHELRSEDGAVASFAEEIWRGRGSSEADLELLCQLISPVPGGRYVRRVAELDDLGAYAPLARSLAATRLLTLSGGDGRPTTVELAHQTLVRAWPRLHREFQRREKFREWQDELDARSRRWHLNRARDDLLRGRALLTAWGERRAHLAELSPRQRVLINASARASAHRSVLRGLALVLVVVLAVSLVNALNGGVATRNDRNAALAAHEILNYERTASMPDGLLSALQAYGLYDDEFTRERLLERYRGLRYVESVFTLTPFVEPTDGRSRINRSGTRLVETFDRSAMIWDLSGAAPVRTFRMPPERPARAGPILLQPFSVAAKPVWLNDDRIAFITDPTATTPGRIVITDARTGRPERALLLDTDVFDLLADPSGRWLALLTNEGTLLADLDRPGTAPRRLARPPVDENGSYFQSGTALLGVLPSGEAVLSVASGFPTILSASGTRPFSPPGPHATRAPTPRDLDTFIDCGIEGRSYDLRLRSLSDNAVLARHTMTPHMNDSADCPRSSVFSSDGALVAYRDLVDEDLVHVGEAGADEGSMRTVQLPPDQRPAALIAEPNGDYRLITVQNHAAMVVRVPAPDALDRTIHRLLFGTLHPAGLSLTAWQFVRFSQDGSHVLLIDPASRAEVWDTRTRHRTGTVPIPVSADDTGPGGSRPPQDRFPRLAERLALSPDGRILASTSSKTRTTTLFRLPDLTAVATIGQGGDSVAFADDRRIMISGSLWSIHPLRRLTRRPLPTPFTKDVQVRPRNRDMIVLGTNQSGRGFLTRFWWDGTPVPGSDVAFGASGLDKSLLTIDPSERFAALVPIQATPTEVQVWDLATRTLVGRLPSPAGLVPVALSFAGDPRHLDVTYTTQNLRWTASSGLAVRRWTRDPWFGLLRPFDPAPRATILTGGHPASEPWRISPDGRLEPTAPAAWLRTLCTLAYRLSSSPACP